MQEFTLSEFKAENDKHNFHHIGLFRHDGGQIVNFNAPHVSPKDKLKEIESFLSSKALPDDFYHIVAKNSLHGKVEPLKYLIKKGSPSDPAPSAQPTASGRWRTLPSELRPRLIRSYYSETRPSFSTQTMRTDAVEPD